MARSGHGHPSGKQRMNISEDALQDEFIFSGGSSQAPQYMRTFGAKSDKAYHPGSSYMGNVGFMHKVAQSSHHLQAMAGGSGGPGIGQHYNNND